MTGILQLGPMEILGHDMVPLIGMFQALDGAGEGALVAIIGQLVLLLMVVGAVGFLVPVHDSSRVRGTSRGYAIALLLLPALTLFLTVIVTTGEPEAILTGLWLAAFAEHVLFLPVAGTTLLLVADWSMFGGGGRVEGYR